MTRPGFDEYVAERSGALLRFAYLLCGDRHLAEDLVQEVLIRAHRRWAGIEADNPDAYLKRALVRTHVSWLRRRSSTEIATDAIRDDTSAAGFDDTHATRDELWALLGTLPRAQRAVLVLRYYEDLDDHRIGEIIGVTPGTVRVHASRGLSALRTTLAERAQQAPEGDGLLDTVRRGAARAARRRAAIAGGLAAIVVVLSLLVPYLLARPESVPPIEPTPSVTSTSTVTPEPPALTLAAPVAVSNLEFPYDFGYLPEGLTLSLVSAIGPLSRIEFTAADAGGAALGVEVSTGTSRLLSFGDFPEDAEFSTVTVNGAQARLYIGDEGSVELAWLQDEGSFFVYSVYGTLGVDELRRIAEGLTPGSIGAIPNPFATVRLPVDWAIRQMLANGLIASNQFGIQDYSTAIDVSITVIEELPARDPNLTYRELDIDGDHAILPMNLSGFGGQLSAQYHPEGLIASRMLVQRSDGRIVDISFTGPGLAIMNLADQGLYPTEADYVAIYRGITFAS